MGAIIPQKIGKRATKLAKPTAAVCHWIVAVPKQEIQQTDLAGSTGESILVRILQIAKEHVKAFQRRRAKGTDPASDSGEGP
jgi:hypothetical protein